MFAFLTLSMFAGVTASAVQRRSDLPGMGDLPTMHNYYNAPSAPEVSSSSHPGWVYPAASCTQKLMDDGAVCLDHSTCDTLSHIPDSLHCPTESDTRTAKFRELFSDQCTAMVDPSSYMGYGLVQNVFDCTMLCSVNSACKSFNIFLDNYSYPYYDHFGHVKEESLEEEPPVFYTCTLFSRALTTAMARNSGCHDLKGGISRISESAAYNRVSYW